MKDLRGAHAAAVRNGILKEFGLRTPNSKKKNLPVDISEWKKTKKASKRSPR